MRFLILVVLSFVYPSAHSTQLRWCYKGNATKFQLYVDCTPRARFTCQAFALTDPTAVSAQRIDAPILSAGKHTFALSAFEGDQESPRSRPIRVKYCYKRRGGQPQMCARAKPFYGCDA